MRTPEEYEEREKKIQKLHFRCMRNKIDVYHVQRRDITWVKDNDGVVSPRLEIHHFKRIIKSHHIHFENNEGEEEKVEVTKIKRRDEATCMICFDEYEIGDVIAFTKVLIAITIFMVV